MNINEEELNTLRKDLENKYNKLEREISILYNQADDEKAKEKEELQDLVDQQIDLIDLIFNNLETTPKMYNELMKINAKYKKQVGD